MKTTLSAALLTELGKTITRPGFLVEIGFATTLRYSSLGTLTWNGQDWTAYDVSVRLPNADGRGFNGAEIVVGNQNAAFGVICLLEGIAGKTVRVYQLYGGATATADGYLAFNGVGDTCVIDQDKVRIKAVVPTVMAHYSPRRRINASTGFTSIIPSGSTVALGNRSVKLVQR